MGHLDQSEQMLMKLVSLLTDWADWQRRCGERLTYPSGSAGFGRGSGVHSFEDMCDRSDNLIMVTIDTAVDDLPAPQASAIYHRYVASVYRFQRLSYVDQLELAHEALIKALPKKGVVLA